MKSLEDWRTFGNPGLYGTIPSSVGELGRLRLLSLSKNSLTGAIPESSAALSNLQVISLYKNSLTGTIPEGLVKITLLERMLLRDNQFTGTIPEFALHSKLQQVELARNLLEGSIPSSLTSLLLLDKLYLYDNKRLNGTIPTTIGKLEELEDLRVFGCQLSGSLPTEFGLLTSLTLLDMTDNRMNSTLPSELGLLTSLEDLYLSNNSFVGTLPSELGFATSLYNVDLQSNGLTGVVPSTLGNLTSPFFGLQNNSISGTLDQIFCDRPLPPPSHLEADCGATSPEVVCTCCTHCCEDASGLCVADVSQVCENTAQEFEHYGDKAGTACECSRNEEGRTALFCRDTTCQYCNEDGSACAERVSYGYVYNEDEMPGRTDAWVTTYQYVVGRDELVKYEDLWFGYETGCRVTIDGKECSSCGTRRCLDGFEAISVDCENIEDGLVLNGCKTSSGAGVLEFLTESFDWDWETCVPVVDAPTRD